MIFQIFKNSCLKIDNWLSVDNLKNQQLSCYLTDDKKNILNRSSAAKSFFKKCILVILILLYQNVYFLHMLIEKKLLRFGNSDNSFLVWGPIILILTNQYTQLNANFSFKNKHGQNWGTYATLFKFMWLLFSQHFYKKFYQVFFCQKMN